MDLKCPCNNCSEHLEFDESAAGETVKCPHCGVDTVLFIPQVALDSQPREPELAPKPKPKTAKIVAHEQKKATFRGGIEERLDNSGDVFGGLGVAGGGGALCGALFLLLAGQITWAVVCAIAATIAFAQGVVINTLFKTGAEAIRLLKKSNGLKFSGEISQPTEQLDGMVAYTCSACGASVFPRAQTKCGKCGAEFGP